MPYHISWISENRIARVVVFGNTNLEEASRLNKDLTRLLDASSPPIDFITDVTLIGKFPTNPHRIKEVLTYLVHPHARWFLIIGDNVLINSIASVLTQFLGTSYRMFKTEPAALAFLAQQEQPLESG